MSDNIERKIRILMDGPYEVSGRVPLGKDIMQCDADGVSHAWEKGESYQPGGEPYYLCRCGRSRTKPYCDGTHEDIGFCGHEHAERTPYADSAALQEGETINLLDDESLCAGARFCDSGVTVWGAVERSADPAYAEMAIQESCACPGGRLTVVDKDGTPVEPDLPREIGLVNDPYADFRGPLWVKGGIAIEGARGERYEVRNRVTLCRCGESRNQPYCDGSHYTCGHMRGQD